MDVNYIVNVDIKEGTITFVYNIIIVFEDSSWKNIITKAKKDISEIQYWFDL